MNDPLTATFQPSLLSWYRTNKRSMPWRDRQDDAYAVWISEIMLQQTTVNAVIGFYHRWMQRFPTLESLAAAPLDDVLRHWAGLGYYARARNLHAAAIIIQERHGGSMPGTVAELLTLPGIGRYTAGAIASISFGIDAPIVDANVIRVLCRLFLLEGDPKTSSAVIKRIWELAEQTIPPGEARDFNQALMELGALICSPTSPNCFDCPVSAYCQAFALGDPQSFPQFAEAKKWIEQTHAACLLLSKGQILIVQRPLKELWGGLWELPRVIMGADEQPIDAAARAVKETVGIEVVPTIPIGKVRHTVTNRKVTLLGFEAEWDGEGEIKALSCRQFAWVDPAEVEQFAVSSPQLELLSFWAKASRQPHLDLQ